MQGAAYVYNTANPGSGLNALYTCPTANGRLTLGVVANSMQVGYMIAANVSSGTNTIAKTATLMNEAGNGVWQGSLTATSFIGPLSGNATTAATLQTARTIALSGKCTGTATSFNGSANISIPVTAVTDAAKWTTARSLTLTGAVTGSASVDGSANISLTATHAYPHNISAFTGTAVQSFSGNPNTSCVFSSSRRDFIPLFSFLARSGACGFVLGGD
jgi:hypothetical protein